MATARPRPVVTRASEMPAAGVVGKTPRGEVLLTQPEEAFDRKARAEDRECELHHAGGARLLQLFAPLERMNRRRGIANGRRSGGRIRRPRRTCGKQAAAQ